MGRYSSVGIATRYGLDGPRIEYRREAKFSAPVQTGPGAYITSCTMGTGSFPGVKQPQCGADHPPPSQCRGHERLRLYFYSQSWTHWAVIWRNLTLPYSESTQTDFIFWIYFREVYIECYYSIIRGPYFIWQQLFVTSWRYQSSLDSGWMTELSEHNQRALDLSKDSCQIKWWYYISCIFFYLW